jgi:hypothetical protein
MTPYDPETGLRVETLPEADTAAPIEAGPRWRPNPFVLALAGTWLVAGTIGLLIWPIGAEDASRLPVLVLAAVCLLTAIAAGVAHLAVLAVAWRAPQE